MFPIMLYTIMRLRTSCGVLLPLLHFELTEIVAETVKENLHNLLHVSRNLMIATAALATMAAKVSPIQKNGISLRMVLSPIRTTRSQVALTRTLSVKSPL
jgi:hypothetical protein